MNRRLFSSVAALVLLAWTANVTLAQVDTSTVDTSTVDTSTVDTSTVDTSTVDEGDAATPIPETPFAPLVIGSPAAPLNIEHWVSHTSGEFGPVTELKAGKVYVVEFWATWCRPCIGCMPHLAEIQTKYKQQNVQVISITDQDRETVETFLKRDYKPQHDGVGELSLEASTPKTYAELTGVYCLTADPDRSVYNDYQRASGRRGIPSAFIVGKTGRIEWMGHPNQMDAALDAVVNDSWDRAAFAKEYHAEQKRDLMLARLSGVLKSSSPKEAVKAIDQALKLFADDPTAMTKLGSMKANIVMTPLYDSIDADDNIKALAIIKDLYPTVSQKVQRQLLGLQVRLQLKQSQFDQAGKTLALISRDESFPAVSLARIVWDIRKQSKGNKKFPVGLFVSGVALAQKAVEQDGNNPYYLSTLARMQRSAGDLDAAIKTQTKAVAKSGGSSQAYQLFLDELKADKDSADRTNPILGELLDPSSSQVFIAAHRGGYENDKQDKAPENSFVNIENCVSKGYKIFETDIQRTKDGHFVMVHDPTIQRETSGVGAVAEQSLQELKKLYKRYRNGSLSSERVATLQQFLDQGKGRTVFKADMKRGVSKHFSDIMKLVTDHNAIEGIIFRVPYGEAGFYDQYMRQGGVIAKHTLMFKVSSQRQVDDIKTRFNASTIEITLSKAKPANAKTLDLIRYATSKGFVVETHAEGDEDDWVKLIEAGVRIFHTKAPSKLKTLLEHRRKPTK